MNLAHCCIDNYINGNLKDAKDQAKHISAPRLYATLREDYGKEYKAAISIAMYLKGQCSWQQACNTDVSVHHS